MARDPLMKAASDYAKAQRKVEALGLKVARVKAKLAEAETDLLAASNDAKEAMHTLSGSAPQG